MPARRFVVRVLVPAYTIGEALEELRLHVEVQRPAAVVVDAVGRRVDVVFAVRFSGDRAALAADGVEVLEVCWRRRSHRAEVAEPAAAILDAWAAGPGVGTARPV